MSYDRYAGWLLGGTLALLGASGEAHARQAKPQLNTTTPYRVAFPVKVGVAAVFVASAAGLFVGYRGLRRRALIDEATAVLEDEFERLEKDRAATPTPDGRR